MLVRKGRGGLSKGRQGHTSLWGLCSVSQHCSSQLSGPLCSGAAHWHSGAGSSSPSATSRVEPALCGDCPRKDGRAVGVSAPISLSPISSSVPVVRSIESSHCAMSWVFSVLRTRTERAHRAGRTVTPTLLDPLQPGPLLALEKGSTS